MENQENKQMIYTYSKIVYRVYREIEDSIPVATIGDYETKEEAIEKCRELMKEDEYSVFKWRVCHKAFVCAKKTGNVIGEFDDCFGAWDFEDRFNALLTMNGHPMKRVFYWISRPFHHVGDFITTVWGRICGIVERRITEPVKYAFERAFFGYDRRVAWDFDLALTDLFVHNLPKYIKNMHGYPDEYTEKARIKFPEIDDERKLSDTAFNMWKDDVSKCLEDFRLYKYYMNYCDEDRNDGTVGFNEKYPKIFLGDYNTTDIDMSKCDELSRKHLDSALDFIKSNLQAMWD